VRIVLSVIVGLRNRSGRWYRHKHVKDLKSAPEIDTPIDESGAAVTNTSVNESPIGVTDDADDALGINNPDSEDEEPEEKQ